MRLLSLLAPGLFAALPATLMPAPPLPALLTLLARADAGSVADVDSDALLLSLFGIAPLAGADAPVAAFSRLGESAAAVADAYWLRADPVHLRADQARLLLFGPSLLNVQEEEARQLAERFNAAFAADGWQLETPHPQRWYLRLPEDPQLATQPLHAVVGRSIDSFLPQGINGRRWRAVLNEVQMLFHDSPVNAAREQQGRLPINSVWFWGGGVLPALGPTRWMQVCSDTPLARGLAVAAGVAVTGPREIAAAWVKEGGSAEQLVLVSTLQDATASADADAWRAAVANLEREWFAPLLAALRSGGLDVLRLYAGDGRAYTVTRAGVRRFWRRRRPLEHYRKASR